MAGVGLSAHGHDPSVLPAELRGHKQMVDTYVAAKIKQFAGFFTQRLNANLTNVQLDQLVAASLKDLHALEQPAPAHNLRLVLRHDCQSTGCGEFGCVLCQYNPSRLCKRNLKAKYLIDDHLRAKCGAALRVEIVEESGQCVAEGLQQGYQLEVHVLNGEKYKEICPDNTLLTHNQLTQCIVTHQKALLRRESMPDDQIRVFMQPERGQAPLSDLQVTTSSEALLCGKAPTFRLLVWAVDTMGEPVAHVTYVVSESFVVATKRVKHAIKSDIPSITDHVSKMVHIGKATVDKLHDLRNAASEEGFDIAVPDNLNCIEKVGDFKQLVELCESNSDVKNKVRHLLKLSPEKWDEVCTHAGGAVVPDFRPRVWWYLPLRSGLLFSCRSGSVMMDTAVAVVKMGVKGGEDDQVVPLHQLDPQMFSNVSKLKTQAIASWYAPTHPGWAIYWRDGQDPAMQAVQQLAFSAAVQAGQTGAAATTLYNDAYFVSASQRPHPYPSPQHAQAQLVPGLDGGFGPGGLVRPGVQSAPAQLTPQQAQHAAQAAMAAAAAGTGKNGMAAFGLANGALPPAQQLVAMQQAVQQALQAQLALRDQQAGLNGQQQQQQQRQSAHGTSTSTGGASQASGDAAIGGANGGASTKNSAFAAGEYMANIQANFPPWPGGADPLLGEGAHGMVAGQAHANNDAAGVGVGFPSLEMLKTEDLVNMEPGQSAMWGLHSVNTDMKSADWLPGLASLEPTATVQALQQHHPHLLSLPTGDPLQLGLKFSMSLDLDKVVQD